MKDMFLGIIIGFVIGVLITIILMPVLAFAEIQNVIYVNLSDGITTSEVITHG